MSDAANRRRDRDKTQMFQSQTQSTTGGESNAAEKAAPPSLLANYPASEAAFDELLADDGKPRPHYSKLIGALEEFSAPELKRRSDTCQRLVHEQGITYNV